MLKNKLQNIVTYGVVALYFFIAVSFYLGTYDSAQIKITIFHVGGLFVIMSWLLLKLEEGNLSLLKKNFIYIFPLLLFLCSGLASFACSPFKLASLNDFIKRIIYCGIVFVLIDQFSKDEKIFKLKNWLLAATVVVCFYGIVQILDYYVMPGLDPFMWRQAFGNRIMSTFGNPNFFGDFLIVMSPIVLALCMYKKNVFLFFLWLIIVFCIYNTVSKGAWLGFAFGIFVFAITYVFIFLRNKLNKKIIIIASISLLFVTSIIGVGIYRKTLERADSASFRVFTWLSTWEMINTHPFFGTGVGTFYVTYPAWRRPQIFFIEGKHNTESDHPESEYLEVWYEEGLVGISVFLTLIILIFVVGYKNMVFLRSRKNVTDLPLLYIQLGIISAFAAQLVHDTVCVSLRFVSSGVMLWLVIGLTLTIAVRLRILNKEIDFEEVNFLRKPVKILLQLVVLTIFLIAIVFTSRFFIADSLHSKAIFFSRNANYADAIATYDKISKYNPSFIMSWYFKASAYIERGKAGDILKAEQTLKNLWELAPNYVQSKYIAGTMYQKKLSKEVELLNKYITEKKPPNIIDSQRKEIAETFNNAVKYYKQYIEIDPIYPQTYYSLASLYANVGNFDEAEKVLKSHLEYPENLQTPPHNFWVEDWAYRRSREYSQTYMHLSSLYTHIGKFEDAKKAYNKTSALNPFNLNDKIIIDKQGK
ncbi:MAG: O-antigen ligase family protein [Endomicrobium sp.]|jgi:O-antigen ligase|nr:O-antigen ligase family protein [Endomicrobium sp.]